MRQAELIFAAILAIFSVYLMYMSQLAPLNIGWVPKKGPGSGALPFWLSLGMLICSIVIFIRGYLRVTAQGASNDVFMDPYTLKIIAVTIAAIFGMLLATHYFGAYVAMFAFMMVYIGIIGNHSWPLTTAVSIAMPVGIFFLFEAGMKILLPKGMTEPLFLPLYKIFVY